MGPSVLSKVITIRGVWHLKVQGLLCRVWATMYHSMPSEEVLSSLGGSHEGLRAEEAASRRERFGLNRLPEPSMPGILSTFLRQFVSPFIYILLGAAVLALLLREWSDAVFIVIIVLLNAVIGTFQEHRAERAARALRNMVSTRARVVRAGEVVEIDAEELVPGDLVQLSGGDKVPADMRLLDVIDFHVDESLLTGESMPVAKDGVALLPESTGLADRANMAWAGTLVLHGRGEGVVVSTGQLTQLGTLASQLGGPRETESPLVMRMRRFTRAVAAVIIGAAAVFLAVEAARGKPISEVALVAIALAVAAIPEGLPVAITVSLAIAMRRMSRRRVIVRRMASVEALGSCTAIASDKTGTLTVNQLTATTIVLPGGEVWSVTGTGTDPAGGLVPEVEGSDRARVEKLIRCGALCNDAVLVREDHGWSHVGDMLDVSLLVLAHKAGFTAPQLQAEAPVVSEMPFESERRYAATLHSHVGGSGEINLKGALEAVLAMCDRQAVPGGEYPLDAAEALDRAEAMASEGYRVIALASKEVSSVGEGRRLHEKDLAGLTFLGLVGMIDPPRETAAEAVALCARAGLRVMMVTGDHPSTALAVARQVGIASKRSQVATGSDLREAAGNAADSNARLDALVARTSVFARVEPSQKLTIVESLIRQGELVAVTGDGANDAPALRRAHVGVAMGRGGTDVAREAADLIVTDDDFSSIVGGIEEGRIAYANVRKVVSLLVSTGAGELVLFLLALIAGLPPPLTALQLLWLNLVTNGVQDVALAFEPAEGNELEVPPRPPGQGVFDRLMVERLAVSALVMGLVAFGTYDVLLSQGRTLLEARNTATASLVLMESVMVFNSRSEVRSAFRRGTAFNPLLVLSTLIALGIHLLAMHLGPAQTLLDIGPLALSTWAWLALASLALLGAVEVDKAVWRHRHPIRKSPNG